MTKFLLNTRTSWNEPSRARHQLAFTLSKKNKVYFISANKVGFPKIEISKINEGLYLIQPYWIINNKLRFRTPIINELFQLWMFRKIRRNFNENIRVINFDHTAYLIHLYFTNVIYYCNDNFIRKSTGKIWFIMKYHKFTERIVLKKSSFCVSASFFLQKKLAKFNSNSFLLLHGAPDIYYNVNISDSFDDVRKKIVYVGWLSKMNFDWAKELSKNKNYDIYMIGHYSQHERKILQDDNVVIMGEKKGEELYAILNTADAFIAPYKIGKETKKVYSMPNKFWLYFRFGRPTITCKIDNLIKVPDGFIYQASSKQDFINNVKLAIDSDNIELRKARIDFAKKNTWNNRVLQLHKIYQIYNR